MESKQKLLRIDDLPDCKLCGMQPIARVVKEADRDVLMLYCPTQGHAAVREVLHENTQDDRDTAFQVLARRWQAEVKLLENQEKAWAGVRKSPALGAIIQERVRQIDELQFDSNHDHQHATGALNALAAYFLLPESIAVAGELLIEKDEKGRAVIKLDLMSLLENYGWHPEVAKRAKHNMLGRTRVGAALAAAEMDKLMQSEYDGAEIPS